MLLLLLVPAPLAEDAGADWFVFTRIRTSPLFTLSLYTGTVRITFCLPSMGEEREEEKNQSPVELDSDSGREWVEILTLASFESIRSRYFFCRPRSLSTSIPGLVDMVTPLILMMADRSQGHLALGDSRCDASLLLSFGSSLLLTFSSSSLVLVWGTAKEAVDSNKSRICFFPLLLPLLHNNQQ